MKGLKMASIIWLAMSMSILSQVNHQGTSTNNNNSSAIGLYCSAPGIASFSSGIGSQSSGSGAHALGMNAQANGLYSFGAGTSVMSNGSYSLALGTFVKSIGSKSVVLGVGYPTSYLENNKPNTLMVGFNSNLPTFFVGASQGPGTYGKVGIATSNPSARLDVNAGSLNGLIIRNEGLPGNTIGIQYLSDNDDFTAIALISDGDTSLRIGADGLFRTDNTLFAKEIKVRIDVWKDDILEQPDQLIPLDSLAEYIDIHHHLPGIMSEEEAISAPVDLGEMYVDLLGKVEELTLYIIALNRENELLQQRLEGISKPKLKIVQP